MAGPALNEAFLDELQRDPEAFRRKWLAETKAQHPEMTERQLDEAWEHAAQLFGLR